MSTAEKRKDSRRDDPPRVFLVRVAGSTPGFARLKSLALPFRSRSTARCSSVHWTFSRRSRPPGSKSLCFECIEKERGRAPLFLYGPSGGIYAGAPAPAEVSRASFSVALDRSLLERPPDVLTTLAPSRVQIPLLGPKRLAEDHPSASLCVSLQLTYLFT